MLIEFSEGVSTLHSLNLIFGTNVRRLRQLKGLSQERLAEGCGLHRTYISAVERGHRSIALKNIALIASVLEVEPYQLLVPEKSNIISDKG